MPNLVERLALVITGDPAGGVAAFKQVGSAARSAATDVAQTNSTTAEGFGRVKQAFQNAGPAAYVGAALAGGAAMEEFGRRSVAAFTDLALSERQYRLAAGGTTDENSRMLAVFKALGINTDEASLAVFRLNKNVAENADTLRKLGVEIKTNSDGTTNANQTLLALSDAYHRTTDSAQRAELVQKAFGRGGQALAPILAATTEQIKALGDAAAARGQIVTPEDEEQALKLQIATRALGEDVKALEEDVGKQLTPTIADLASGLDVAATKADHLASGVGGLGGLFRAGLSVATLGGTEGLIEFGESGDKASKAQAALELQTKAATTALTEQQTELDQHAKDVDTLESSVTGLVHAQESMKKATETVATAQRDEQKAQRDLTTLQKQGRVDVDAVASAETKLADASKTVARAQRDESDAAKAVEKALADVAAAQKNLDTVRQGANPEDVTKAQLDLADAKRSQEEATLGVSDAETTYSATLHDTSKTATDLERAGLGLDAAHEQVQRSALAVTDAQAKLNELQNQGKEGSKDLADAEQKVADASDAVEQAKRRQADQHDAVTKAQQDEKAAHDDLTKAQAGDPDFDQKLADARQKVADAHQHVADATLAARDAAVGLADAAKKEADALAAGQSVASDVLTIFEQIAALNPALAATFKPITDLLTTAATGAPSMPGRGGIEGPGTGPTTVGPTTLVTVHTGASATQVASAISQYNARNGVRLT